MSVGAGLLLAAIVIGASLRIAVLFQQGNATWPQLRRWISK